MDRLPFHILEEILFKLDPKSLAMMQCTDRSINSHITDDPLFKSVYKKDHYDEGVVHGNDLKANKLGVMDWIPRWCDSKRDFYQSKPSLTSSSMELDENVDVDMTMVNHDDDKRIFSLSKITRLISGISPYAQSLFKKKGKLLGKRLMIEEETKLKMMIDEPNSSEFLDVERINKRRRVK
ncbi:F-box domain [Arabidopsis suecica]|uniref:F-box domain n=1 Tax=Arabidopsis suecica TaxID=45249 RepID=A0A8T2CE59_ARASU|nr:F-box domain [Arabidopsis suecica]